MCTSGLRPFCFHLPLGFPLYELFKAMEYHIKRFMRVFHSKLFDLRVNVSFLFLDNWNVIFTKHKLSVS